MFSSKKKIIHFSIHAIIWAVFLSIPFVLKVLGAGELKGQYLFNYYLNSVMNAAVFYSFYLYFLPKILAKGKFKKFFLFAFLFVILFSLLNDLFVRSLHILIYGEYFHKELFSITYILSNIFRVTFFAVFSAFTRFTIDWFRNIYEKEKIKRQNLSSELNMLKLQVSPHFLMNTLNNIYSLVLKKSDDAPNALLKLSEILRYMLYDANVEKMPMGKEILYIKNYIELQQLRLNKKQYANIAIEHIDEQKKIAPLILIPFIENAFKHGNRNISKDCIRISIKEKGQFLIFHIENQISKTPLNKDESGGIGLENVKRRLELLYPNMYQLEISNKDYIFTVHLKIELS